MATEEKPRERSEPKIVPPCRPEFTYGDRIRNMTWAAVGGVFGAIAKPLIDVIFLPVVWPALEPLIEQLLLGIGLALKMLGA